MIVWVESTIIDYQAPFDQGFKLGLVAFNHSPRIRNQRERLLEMCFSQPYTYILTCTTGCCDCNTKLYEILYLFSISPF